MREILFRGKRLDNGEWVEGYLIKTNGYLLKTNGFAYIVYPDCFADDLFYSLENIICAVDPSTVGQFTGLLDKNGKRIFEGDIVTYCWYEVEPVNFCVDFVSGEFLAVPIKKLDGVWAVRISGTNKKMEVIGDIHDGEFGGGRE